MNSDENETLKKLQDLHKHVDKDIIRDIFESCGHDFDTTYLYINSLFPHPISTTPTADDDLSCWYNDDPPVHATATASTSTTSTASTASTSSSAPTHTIASKTPTTTSTSYNHDTSYIDLMHSSDHDMTADTSFMNLSDTSFIDLTDDDNYYHEDSTNENENPFSSPTTLLDPTAFHDLKNDASYQIIHIINNPQGSEDVMSPGDYVFVLATNDIYTSIFNAIDYLVVEETPQSPGQNQTSSIPADDDEIINIPNIITAAVLETLYTAYPSYIDIINHNANIKAEISNLSNSIYEEFKTDTDVNDQEDYHTSESNSKEDMFDYTNFQFDSDSDQEMHISDIIYKNKQEQQDNFRDNEAGIYNEDYSHLDEQYYDLEDDYAHHPRMHAKFNDALDTAKIAKYYNEHHTTSHQDYQTEKIQQQRQQQQQQQKEKEAKKAKEKEKERQKQQQQQQHQQQQKQKQKQLQLEQQQQQQQQQQQNRKAKLPKKLNLEDYDMNMEQKTHDEQLLQTILYLQTLDLNALRSSLYNVPLHNHQNLQTQQTFANQNTPKSQKHGKNKQLTYSQLQQRQKELEQQQKQQKQILLQQRSQQKQLAFDYVDAKSYGEYVTQLSKEYRGLSPKTIEYIAAFCSWDSRLIRNVIAKVNQNSSIPQLDKQSNAWRHHQIQHGGSVASQLAGVSPTHSHLVKPIQPIQPKQQKQQKQQQKPLSTSTSMFDPKLCRQDDLSLIRDIPHDLLSNLVSLQTIPITVDALDFQDFLIPDSIIEAFCSNILFLVDSTISEIAKSIHSEQNPQRKSLLLDIVRGLSVPHDIRKISDENSFRQLLHNSSTKKQQNLLHSLTQLNSTKKKIAVSALRSLSQQYQYMLHAKTTYGLLLKFKTNQIQIKYTPMDFTGLLDLHGCTKQEAERLIVFVLRRYCFGIGSFHPTLENYSPLLDPKYHVIIDQRKEYVFKDDSLKENKELSYNRTNIYPIKTGKKIYFPFEILRIITGKGSHSTFTSKYILKLVIPKFLSTLKIQFIVNSKNPGELIIPIMLNRKNEDVLYY